MLTLQDKRRRRGAEITEDADGGGARKPQARLTLDEHPVAHSPPPSCDGLEGTDSGALRSGLLLAASELRAHPSLTVQSSRSRPGCSQSSAKALGFGAMLASGGGSEEETGEFYPRAQLLSAATGNGLKERKEEIQLLPSENTNAWERPGAFAKRHT